MISTEPITFEQALAFARAKQILPTSLTSAELAAIHAQLKQRAVFSARMALTGFLDTLQQNLTLIASGNEDEHGRIRSIPEAKAQLLEALKAAGYQPNAGEEGTIKDFFTDARLSLIVETNVLDVLGAGRYEAGTDEVALDVNPGWRLVRTIHSRVPRDWWARWLAAGASVGWKGASQTEMVALKNSPIWQALGNGAGGYHDTLGNPWAPFAFNSGMNTISVSRAECEQLGLLAAGEKIAAPAKRDLNESLEASAGQFSAELAHALANDPELRMDGKTLRLASNSRTDDREENEELRARVCAFLSLAEEAA